MCCTYCKYLSVFVYNKVEESEMTSNNAHNVQNFLDKFFASTSFGKNGNVRPPFILDQSANHVNFYMIPRIPNPQVPHALMYHFKQLIYSMPKTKWSKSISEKDWLQSASRVWDLIQKSHFISEYNRSYQKLQLYKT